MYVCVYVCVQCVCVCDVPHAHRSRDDESGLYEQVQKLDFVGAVEGLAFAKVRMVSI